MTDIAAALAAKDKAPLPAGKRSPVLCDNLDMRIARDGTWFYHGSPIGRKPLVKLFASVLSRDQDGAYWLTTPVEKGRIDVDDAPFIAVALTARGYSRCYNVSDGFEGGHDAQRHRGVQEGWKAAGLPWRQE